VKLQIGKTEKEDGKLKNQTKKKKKKKKKKTRFCPANFCRWGFLPALFKN